MRGARRVLAGVCLAVAALLAAPASAKERLLLPTDEWTLGKRDESCFVSRNFADPEGEPLEVQIEAFGPGAQYKFTMVGEGLPLRDGRRRGVATIRYRFKPDPEWRQAGAKTAYRSGTDVLIFLSDLASAAERERRQRLFDDGQPTDLRPFQPDRARAAAVSQFALSYPARDDTVVQLAPLDAPIEQLHGCTRELARKWGYDPAALEALQRGPRVRNARELAQTLIGALMKDKSLRQNEAISFRLDVDAAGAVTGCTLQAPRQNPALGEAICAMLSDKAEIEPARDAAGQPVGAPLVSAFSFGV